MRPLTAALTLTRIVACSTVVSANTWTDMRKSLEDAKNGVDGFARNQAGPALAQAGESLDKFQREKINPALAQVGKSMDTYGREQLGQMLAEAGSALERVGREKAVPALAGAGNTIDRFIREKIHPALAVCDSKILQPVVSATAEMSSRTFESLPHDVKNELKKVQGQVFQIDISTIPDDFLRWMKNNPVQTGLYITGAVLIIAPELITGPVLWGLGLASQGPRAASIASALQATIGNVPAGSIFAQLQSAAMGGYGLQTVYTAAQVGAAVVGGVGIAMEIEKMCKKDSMPPAMIGGKDHNGQTKL